VIVTEVRKKAAEIKAEVPTAVVEEMKRTSGDSHDGPLPAVS
jgi:hypothetical protein